MSTIVPRWEWRRFGDDFGEADTQFAAKPPERVQESDESYLLSTLSDASVKVRDVAVMPLTAKSLPLASTVLGS